MTDTEKVALLRSALLGLVGTDDSAELLIMANALMHSSGPAHEMLKLLTAIDALERTR